MKSIIQKGLKILIVRDLDLRVIVFSIQRKVDGTPVKAPTNNQEVYRICSNIFYIFIIVLIYL